jgi:hypothetical protein
VRVSCPPDPIKVRRDRKCFEWPALFTRLSGAGETGRRQSAYARSAAVARNGHRSHPTSTIVEDELGLEFSTWRKFFDTAATRDLLDFCDYRLSPGGETTIRRRDISREMGSRRSANLCQGKFTLPARFEGRRAFFPGQELVRVAAAAIVILPSPRCTNSLDALNKGLAALANAPPDGKEAIRGIFSAIEGLFRLTFPDVERLATKALDRLRPLILTSYPGDRPAIEAIRENAVKEAARRYSPAAIVKVSHDVVSGAPAEIFH